MIGIHDLPKDRLVICLDEITNGRPKDFTSPKGSDIHLLKLRRAAK